MAVSTKTIHGEERTMVNGASRGERLQIMLSAEELTILDDFRFRKRMPSRAAAIRELLKRGLAAEGFEAAAFRAKSEEFGVIEQASDGQDTR
jgi:hypothetical protein